MKTNTLITTIIAIASILFFVPNIKADEVPDSVLENIKNLENEDKPVWFKYLPKISGVLKTRFEWQPEIGASRFQVRNARIGVSGDVLSNVSYKAEIDFCDAGKIKVLDVFGKVSLFDKQLGLTLGQMRVPFSVDAKRGPTKAYFANRSFLAKQMGNVRDVGFMAGYYPDFGLNVEAGVFNGNGLTNQTPWNKTMIYAGRVNYSFSGFKAEVGVLSQRPENVRINIFDASLSWTYNNLFIEAEYMNKHYTNNAFKTAQGYNIMANYSIPLNKFFNSMSVQARWDSMTDHSDGKTDENGKLIINDNGRNRLTAGVTFSFFKKIGADVRLNYEKYFYHDDNIIIDENGYDKLVVELVVKF